MSSLTATATEAAKFKTNEWIYFQQSRQHSSRAGYVKTARRDGGYHVRLVQNSTIVDVERVSASDARRQMRAVQPVEQDAEFKAHAADWRVLAHDREHGGGGSGKKKKAAAADADAMPCDTPYVALHEALRKERPSGTKNERRLRLGTFNVCHLGGGANPNPPEKIRNLAAVIRRSLSDVVVLQEVSTNADETVALLAAEIGGGDWGFRLSDATGGSGPAKGECYALLYNRTRVETVLGGEVPAVESFMYNRRDTGHAAFRREAEWGTAQRADFSFAGASAARLPGFFRLASCSGRSLVVATVHTAFSDAATRRQQFRALGSLLPSKPLDCSRCVFALLGDFNSNASNTEGMTSSASFAQTKFGQALADELTQRCRFSNVSNHHDATSWGGAHYDEAYVQADAVGSRHAHVYPIQRRIAALAREAVRKRRPGGGGGGPVAAAADLNPLDVFTPPELRPERGSIHHKTFDSCVFTDHLLVFVDVEFQAPSELPAKGRRLYAKAVAAQATAAPRASNSSVASNRAAAEAPSSDLTVVALREQLRERGLKVGGNKAELVARLQASSDLPKLTVAVLKDMLRSKSLSVSGKKAELVARLMGAGV
uniref:SAP domain-containing protein n=2 Tax=Florenciella parvula TaxID=236787 RepID=A0A7S2CEE5_9STRA|mmetsp:Transcript_28049/g.57577  ORF Transcript_28049/g.57577 Transcript_28049/m.57577 type:complete len:600 (+) Transcript_28049:85-1884(+)|eukprot:CAMPEP_0182533052 /NCGR_PEP_ID=MMETSP1323-20130603/12979_1 /TAXON_ID=236787 /ORGANISM="Florenciella parvula, Strain RCC1693" /LENGTH=599 /DNA_ID=CAMNT_0024742881 /DNA_START=85 /DNA_END=1887 /DNA_ORIENTATION=+